MKIRFRRVLGLLALALSAFAPSVHADSPRLIGVNLSGGDFGTVPGVLGTDYFFPSAAHWDWAKSQGMELVRMPFRWERVQHDNNGVLDATLWAPDIAAIDTALNLAEARGMRVILDMHNYGGRSLTINGVKAGYKIGSPELPTAAFANAWKLLANHFKGRKSLWGYDIMNEPVGLAGGATAWAGMAQAAVTAIREVDTSHAIILEGYFYAQASSWNTNGAPLINVVDPANNLIYSAHMYPDRDQSGTWSHGGSVQAELVNSGQFATVADALWVGRNRIKPFVDWCVANNVRGLVGEYGVPRVTDAANWAIVLKNQLDYMRDNGNGLISATQWGGGAWNSTYVIGMGPRKDHSNPPFMVEVANHVLGPGSSYWQPFTWYQDSLTVTADYTFSYVYPITTPATVTINTADTSTFHSGTQSIQLSYTVPVGVNAGAGTHTRGPLAIGGVGGVSIAKSLAAGHVLSFYAKGTPGANPQITIGKTTDANGVDNGSVSGTGNYVSLGSIHPLTTSWQLYEIPLSAFINSSLTGATHVQRLMFNALPADGNTYTVNLDRITIGIPSTNTAPTVSVNTSTGGSTFTAGQSITFVATAADAGGSLDYVEFYRDHQKIGIAQTAPYQWTTTAFTTPGTYEITAIAVDNFGIATQSAVKTITITSGPPTTVSITSTHGEDGWVLESTATSSVGGSFGLGKIRVGDNSGNRQYMGILSFDTSSIPDGAVITSATLQLRRALVTGTNPFTTHGSCTVAISTGGFGGSTALAAADFQAAATASNVATMSNAASDNTTSTGALNAAGLGAINKTGKTQLRLSFTLADNGDAGDDYLLCNEANDINPAKRPTLIITYQ